MLCKNKVTCESSREEMILGKQLTPDYIFHLMLVTVTNLNPPQKYKSMSGLSYACKTLHIPALMIICFGEKSWGKTTDKDMAKIKLGGGKVYLYD